MKAIGAIKTYSPFGLFLLELGVLLVLTSEYLPFDDLKDVFLIIPLVQAVTSTFRFLRTIAFLLQIHAFIRFLCDLFHVKFHVLRHFHDNLSHDLTVYLLLCTLFLGSNVY